VVQAIAKPLICAKLFPRTIQSHHDKSVVTPYPRRPPRPWRPRGQGP
jgi:hypothetical protein